VGGGKWAGTWGGRKRQPPPTLKTKKVQGKVNNQRGELRAAGDDKKQRTLLDMGTPTIFVFLKEGPKNTTSRGRKKSGGKEGVRGRDRGERRPWYWGKKTSTRQVLKAVRGRGRSKANGPWNEKIFQDRSRNEKEKGGLLLKEKKTLQGHRLASGEDKTHLPLPGGRFGGGKEGDERRPAKRALGGGGLKGGGLRSPKDFNGSWGLIIMKKETEKGGNLGGGGARLLKGKKPGMKGEEK